MEGPSRNILVLAPLTPAGSRAYLERLAEACGPTDCLITVSYTQSPDAWAANWEETVGPLPDHNAFFYADIQNNEADSAFESVITVDPTDPMSIITGVEEQLKECEQAAGRPVVSLQTLSVLLEYTDFDTAFRYLYLLVEKTKAANAVGYYQIDPHLHDAEELNTLRSLFDSVVEFSEGSWTESSATPDPTDEASDSERKDGLTTTLRTWWSNVVSSFSTSEDSPETTATDGNADRVGSAASTSEVTLTEEELLTDQERIRRFLQLSGGRARQADMTDAFSWSASTVSRKLSKMESADQISRVKIGRENVVFLEDSEPDAIKSPFQSESDSNSASESSQ